MYGLIISVCFRPREGFRKETILGLKTSNPLAATHFSAIIPLWGSTFATCQLSISEQPPDNRALEGRSPSGQYNQVATSRQKLNDCKGY